MRDALPRLEFAVQALALLLELVVGAAELGDGLLSKQLLQRPLFNVLLLVFLELRDEAHGTRQDGSLVLFTAGDNLGELVDALIDGFSSAAFHYVHVSMSLLMIFRLQVATYLLCGYPCASCAIPPNRRPA